MNLRPWRDGTGDSGAPGGPVDGDPRHSCAFQDGTLSVYEDRVVITRASRSKFDDKSIPIGEIQDVTYAKRLVISYIQIAQDGVSTDSESLLSTPVDPNTLHFGRGKRDCARQARDAILERMAAEQPTAGE